MADHPNTSTEDGSKDRAVARHRPTAKVMVGISDFWDELLTLDPAELETTLGHLPARLAAYFLYPDVDLIRDALAADRRTRATEER